MVGYFGLQLMWISPGNIFLLVISNGELLLTNVSKWTLLMFTWLQYLQLPAVQMPNWLGTCTAIPLRYAFTGATVAIIATGVFLLKRLLVSCPLSSEQVVLLQRWAYVKKTIIVKIPDSRRNRGSLGIINSQNRPAKRHYKSLK